MNRRLKYWFGLISDRARKIRVWTFRGFLVLGASLLALKLLAFPESDLIAYVLGGIGLALTIILAIVALVSRIILERTVTAEAHVGSGVLTSNAPVPAGILLRRCALPFGFTLAVRRRFQHGGAKAPVHLISGAKQREKTLHLIDALEFPHRGVWHISDLELTLEDALGLTSLSWEIPVQLSIEISPPAIAIRPLPIVASSAEAGDEMNISQERTGDLFDLKQYDPSDGIKRILWKTYAKSGELVVRRPEPAYIPEGEVAIYLVSNRNEDYVAGAFLGYFALLENQNIVTLFGADGLSAAASKSAFCSSPAEIRRAVNVDVWSSMIGTGRGFENYLNALRAAGKPPSRVIVFAPAERADWYQPVADVANARQVKLSVAVVPRGIVGRFGPASAKFGDELSSLEALRTQFRRAFRPRQQRAANGTAVHDLPELVRRPGGELFVCEGSL